MSTAQAQAQPAQATAAHRVVKLPAIGTLLPHLSGVFWALQRAKPGSGAPDYAIVVPTGPEFELRDVAWGAYGKDRPDAACQWDGLANTLALLQHIEAHPVMAPLADTLKGQSLYLPSLRELKALYANGCDAFDPERWYWSSTQFSRTNAFYQGFNSGYTTYNYKDWEGGCARFVRRFPIESLID